MRSARKLAARGARTDGGLTTCTPLTLARLATTAYAVPALGPVSPAGRRMAKPESISHC